ncbi:hypothetical protein [Tissierella sp.]|uniref:hypothetical protein n=1 Tax=Tissierella sp. TaxID=41274 RepID=UPI002864F102|nr:hypothetical protein [Tissierella sp.]MDR7856116.1 hypothetical protein [Tissierella sp.]
MLTLQLENGITYKSINTPIIKKVMAYVNLGGGQSVCSGEYNKEINTFAEENEKNFN